MATSLELLYQVRKYAEANYDSGWDSLVECATDKELLEAIGKARTFKGALAKCHAIWIQGVEDRRECVDFGC